MQLPYWRQIEVMGIMSALPIGHKMLDMLWAEIHSFTLGEE
jgi:hypothetical protein